MDSLRHPVGRMPAAVYWRRRLVVLAAFLAALALILYACSGSSGKKKPPVGISTPTGAVSTDTPSGPPGGSPSSGASAGATPSASADGGSSGATSASAGATGADGGQNGGATGPGGTASGTAAPGACQLKLSLVSSSHDYANGEQPVFSVAIVNDGTSGCTADVGPKSLVLTVFSGSDRIWSTADCGTAKQDLRAVPPGGVQQVSIAWPRTRSVPGCTGTPASAAVGTYYAQATLGTGTGTPQAATFTTSQQTFVLKTGS